MSASAADSATQKNPSVTLAGAPTTEATFLYDTKSQDLYFDDDGSGVHGAQKIVHFDTPVTLHANDFDIVA
jgi:hypothetical protein